MILQITYNRIEGRTASAKVTGVILDAFEVEPSPEEIGEIVRKAALEYFPGSGFIEVHRLDPPEIKKPA